MEDEKKISRRKFLGLAGGVIGATALTCSGVVTIGFSQPKVEMNETSYETGEKMNKKVLVTYASRAGSTAEIAGAIAKTFMEKGLDVEVLQAKNVKDISQYQAVIIGSAIYMGSWMSDAVKFIENNQAELKQIPTALFIGCQTMGEDTKENREKVAAYQAPLREMVSPVAEGYFAGALEPKKLPLLYRLIIKSMKIEPGDYRNWNVIRAWSEQAVPLLGI